MYDLITFFFLYFNFFLYLCYIPFRLCYSYVCLHYHACLHYVCTFFCTGSSCHQDKFLVCVNIVTGWKGTRDKESSNQKPRRVDIINPCLRAWVVMPFGLVAVFSIVSRCGWIRAVLVVVLVGHTLLSGMGERERVRFLSHGEASRLVSVSTLLKSRQADEPQVWPISPWWAVNRCSSCISRATLTWTRDARHNIHVIKLFWFWL